MTRVPLLYGAAAFGEPNTNTTRIHTLTECQEVVDAFVGQGHRTFDTSRLYGKGTSEEFLGKLDLKGANVDTKVFPERPGDFAPAKLRETFNSFIKALAPNSVNVLYLHAPDRSVPVVDTLREVNELYKEGLFKEFGLSNYFSWEVVEIYYICAAHGWVKPTVYQGLYNAIERTVETELLPALKKLGIRFHAYSPLAGGVFAASTMTAEDLRNSKGNRFDPKAWNLAPVFQARYAPLLPALNELKAALVKYDITPAQAALRWLQHHSMLTESDGVIIGASSLEQLNANLLASEGGPLPQEVIQLIDEANKKSSVFNTYYARL